MTLETQNDQRRLIRIIDLLDVIDRMEFQTEIGQKFHNTMKEALNEIIKPTARDCYKQLNNK
jgi:hypothetical protein